jgi:hypothetical protein
MIEDLCRDRNKLSSPWIAGKCRTLDCWRWSRPLGSLQNYRAGLIRLQRSRQKSISFDCHHRYSRADPVTKSKRRRRVGRAATAVELIEDERADSAQSNSSRMNEEEQRRSGLVEDEQRGTEREWQKS